jgi:hypothetical protein
MRLNLAQQKVFMYRFVSQVGAAILN